MLVFFCLLILAAWSTNSLFVFNSLWSPLAAATAIFTASAVVKHGGPRPVADRATLALAAWLTWITLIDLGSDQPMLALTSDGKWFLLVLLSYCLTGLFRRDPNYYRALRLTAGLSIWLLIYVYSARTLWLDPAHYNWFGRLPILGHIRHVAMTAGLFTAVLLDDSALHGFEKRFVQLSAMLGLALILWSGSRGAAGVLVLILLFIAIQQWRAGQFRPWLLLQLLPAYGLALLFSTGHPGMELFHRDAVPTTSQLGQANEFASGRLEIWTRALGRAWHDGTLLQGSGGNAYLRLGLTPTRLIFHPHNGAIQFILDWGIIGLILAGTALWLIIIKPARSLLSVSPQRLAAPAFLIGVGQLDGALYHLELLIFLACGFAACLSALPSSDQERRAPLSANQRMALLLLLFTITALHMLMLDYTISWRFDPRPLI